MKVNLASRSLPIFVTALISLSSGELSAQYNPDRDLVETTNSVQSWFEECRPDEARFTINSKGDLGAKNSFANASVKEGETGLTYSFSFSLNSMTNTYREKTWKERRAEWISGNGSQSIVWNTVFSRNASQDQKIIQLKKIRGINKAARHLLDFYEHQRTDRTRPKSWDAFTQSLIQAANGNNSLDGERLLQNVYQNEKYNKDLLDYAQKKHWGAWETKSLTRLMGSEVTNEADVKTSLTIDVLPLSEELASINYELGCKNGSFPSMSAAMPYQIVGSVKQESSGQEVLSSLRLARKKTRPPQFIRFKKALTPQKEVILKVKEWDIDAKVVQDLIDNKGSLSARGVVILKGGWFDGTKKTEFNIGDLSLEKIQQNVLYELSTGVTAKDAQEKGDKTKEYELDDISVELQVKFDSSSYFTDDWSR